MHHTIKGVRSRRAWRTITNDPDWLRWNYATVVWGIATGHELYHPTPLRNIFDPLLRRVRAGRSRTGGYGPAGDQGRDARLPAVPTCRGWP